MNKKSSRGFTIVELLVVIVVIGILAAITIVSYSGITAKANTAKALSNAQSVANVLEVMNADNAAYPATTGAIETGSASAKLASAIDVVPNAGTNPLIAATGNDKFDITYECNAACGGGTHTGGRVGYWDFSAGAVVYVTYGAGGSGTNPAS